jgi:CBS domain-containing protein
MQARDIMTRDVASARPDTTTQEIARLLVGRGISAVPVIDEGGSILGMVSEGDLIDRDDAGRLARRDWWLQILAEGTELSPAFLAELHTPARTARDIMTTPIVTVGEDTDVRDVARLLATHRVKRVPVVHDGKVVGIVSRADLVGALARDAVAAPSSSARSGPLGEVLSRLDEHFRHRDAPLPHAPGAPTSRDEPAPLAQQFRGIVLDFQRHEGQQREKERRLAAKQRRDTVTKLIEDHISDEAWRSLLHEARQAAERGEGEFLLLRFPSELCSDGGRTINQNEPGWPSTLRGEAAEVYLRWERELKPHGFHLAAEVLEFPGGKPGDAGLFLVWGKPA